jgi:Flp pilus assembly protein TadD
MTTLESLQKAFDLHRSGQLEEAERMYRQVLAVEPANIHALHLLGVAAHQRGQHARAVEYIGQAVKLDPGQFTFHLNLSAAHMALGRVDDAIGALREVVRLEPGHAKAQNDMGVLLANAFAACWPSSPSMDRRTITWATS